MFIIRFADIALSLTAFKICKSLEGEANPRRTGNLQASDMAACIAILSTPQRAFDAVNGRFACHSQDLTLATLLS